MLEVQNLILRGINEVNRRTMLMALDFSKLDTALSGLADAVKAEVASRANDIQAAVAAALAAAQSGDQAALDTETAKVNAMLAELPNNAAAPVATASNEAAQG